MSPRKDKGRKHKVKSSTRIKWKNYLKRHTPTNMTQQDWMLLIKSKVANLDVADLDREEWARRFRKLFKSRPKKRG